METHPIRHQQPKVNQIIQHIEEGDYKIPTFQRGFVWRLDQVLDLLDSIYHDYPIGTVLLWETVDRLRTQRNLGGFLLVEKEPQYPVNYVLDGQQRLSTLYAVFSKNATLDPDNAKYGIEPGVFDIWFDLDDKKFIHADSLNTLHKNIKLKGLFDPAVFFPQVAGLPNPYQAVAYELQTRFVNYEVPMVVTQKRAKDEVGIIFERINNTGTKLSTLDLMIAWTWDEDFHLKEQMDDLTETLSAKGFGDLPDKIVLQCLSGIIKKATSTKAILGLPPADVKSKFPLLTESVAKAIDFMSTQFNMKADDFLPHAQQVVPLTYFFSQTNMASVGHTKAITQWFWKTSFSRRYSEQTDDKMDEDIEFMGEVIAGRAKTADKYSHAVTPAILQEQRFTRGSPFVRAFLLLMAQKRPRDLTNANFVDLGTALSGYNIKEYHHIFPRAFLKDRGLDRDKINSLCNFCFLPADSNKKISRSAPSDYIFRLVPDAQYADILNSNLMPLKKEVYKKDDYDAFLAERAGLIIAFLDSLTV